MKRLLCLCLACMLCMLTPALASETQQANYNTAGKLLKQLWAGSGFSGTLTLEITPNEGRLGQSITTQKPLSMDVDYIYVRPTATETAQHRLDLRLMDGETQQTAAHVQLKDGATAVQADIIGADWYLLSGGTSARPQDDTQTQAPQALAGLEGQAGEVLSQTGMPTLLSYALPLLLKMQGQTQELDDVTEAFITRIDLWIEGYRQNAVLGKLKDDTSTMTVQYSVPPTAIKAQAKQMVLDLLSDEAALGKLRTLMGAQDAALLLNPQLQSYYFKSIDDLPLTGDMTIERTVSLKGNTLGLHIALPMYDAAGGASVIRYDRTSGMDDLPDENIIALESPSRTTTLTYQEYSSMADVTVWQGALVSQPTEDATQKALGAAFTLTLKQTEGRDESDRDTYDCDATLVISPDTQSVTTGELVDFTETEIALNTHFASKTLQTAATEMTATLTIGGTEQPGTIKLSLTGKSRKKWTPDALPDTLIDVRQMSDSELNALLPGIVTRGGLMLLSYFNLPVADATPEPGDATQAPDDSTPTPEVFDTLAPGMTLAPVASDAPETAAP